MTAVDFSDVALGKGARLAESRGVDVDWVVADILEYEPEPTAFDLVVVLYPAAARGARPALARRRRGRSGRDAVRPGARHDEPRRRLRRPEGCLRAVHAGDVTAALEGLVVERAEKVERTVALDDGEATAIDALVRATRPPMIRGPRPHG